jgi:hypothetical protein
MTLDQYSQELRKAGLRVVNGADKSLWISHERFALQRQPHFALHVPSRDEIQTVFAASHALLLSFVSEPTRDQSPNSVLYLCRDPEYSHEKLHKGGRIRRGLREFELRETSQEEVLALGFAAYRDSRTRNHLSRISHEAFESRFRRFQPAIRYFGAFKDGKMAAFCGGLEVEDWASIGGWSADAFLSLRPNDALIYFVSYHYLVKSGVQALSYGLSSVQTSSNASGLHQFKVKMGFEAIPVRRTFILNPLVRPIINRTSWKVTNSLHRLWPGNVMLKKAEGALRMAIQGGD